MKVLKIIAIIIVIIIAAVFITIQVLPDEAHLTRSVTMDASPQEVFNELITFKNFNSWSPWAEKDTTATYLFEGPAIGIGAKMSWISEDPQVGSGAMEIIDIKENELVKVAMKFGGFDSSPTASYIIEQQEEGTKLSWTYDEYDVSGINRILGAMMDQFLGPDYEKGLSNLKSRIESAPDYATELSIVNVASFDYLGITTSSNMEMVSSKMAQSYGSIMAFMGQNGFEIDSYPIAIYHTWTPEEATFTCGIRVDSETTDLTSNIKRGTIASGLAIKSVYIGDYAGGEAPHIDIDNYINFAGYEMIGPPWEEYVTDPEVEPDTSKWITNVYYPVN